MVQVNAIPHVRSLLARAALVLCRALAFVSLLACGSQAANDADADLGETTSELRKSAPRFLPADCAHKPYTSAFEDALTKHDACYRTCGLQRCDCDAALDAQLHSACSKQRNPLLRKACLRAANGLNDQTLNGAQQRFDAAQKAACPPPVPACSPHDINTSKSIPTPINAAACSDVFLSDICPVAEFNVNGCVTFDSTYWEDSVEVDGTIYSKAISTHPPDLILDAAAERLISDCRFFEANALPPGVARVSWDVSQFDQFSAELALASANGLEGEPNQGGTVFRVYLDNEVVFSSEEIVYSTPLVPLTLNFQNKQNLVLEVDAAGSNYADHAVWLNARLRRTCGEPR